MRSNGRKNGELRKVKITANFLEHPEGSCLIEMGKTKVICTASFEDNVPPFLRGKGKGWITSEYSMLPRATNTRNRRESTTGKVSGRTQEIQRLIGRSLRSVVDMEKLGSNTFWIDCDVIQADGGTRTASITGSYVALSLAINKMIKCKKLFANPMTNQVAAISVGVVNGQILLDLDYSEDSEADLDMNLVMNKNKEFIEIQGTAEKKPATKKDIDEMISIGWKGINELFKVQNSIINKIRRK